MPKPPPKQHVTATRQPGRVARVFAGLAEALVLLRSIDASLKTLALQAAIERSRPPHGPA